MAESISLAETNKIRIAAGLAPLADTSAGDAPILNDEQIAVQNWQELRDKEQADKATQDLKDRLDKARNQRDFRAKLAGKSLGEADEGDDNARSWVKKAKKQAKNVAAELAKKRALELAQIDAELAASYAEDDLAGLKVGHDADAFDEGKEHVLTLKDSRVLDDEDDELVDDALTEDAKLKERLELKKKGKDAHKYKPYEDDETLDGKRGVLSKYDVDIDGADQSVKLGFTLGRSLKPSIQEEGTTFEAVAKPVVKTTEARQELAKELNKTLVDLSYEKTFSTSDYLQEGDAGFKKLKKKKRSTRKKEIDQDEEPNGDAVMHNRTTQDELEQQALVDDDDLQSALARQRRARNRQNLVSLKRAQSARAMSVDQPSNDSVQVKEEPEDDDSKSGLILDDTSEFVRNITIEAPITKRSVSPMVTADETITSLEIEPAKVEEEPEEGEAMEIDRAQEAALLAGDVKETDGLEGTSAELHVNRGLASTMNILRQQGLMKGLTPEEAAAERISKDRQSWLVARRQQQAEIEAAKYAARQAGSSKDQRTRELENKAREKEMAKRDLEAFREYKPQIEIKYTDDHGREMSTKEAWKHLSHNFHGKGSGTLKQEKRLKKIDDEKKRTAMASGDTPLSTNSAFQARQEKLGSATMVLSVGNKMTAPSAEDFQTSGTVDPSKKIPTSKKAKAAAAKQAAIADSINLTPTLDIAPAPLVSVPTDGSLTPAPRRAGFKPINKRRLEEIEPDETASKRVKE